MTDKQFQELKEFLAEEQRDLALSAHQSKDKEISGLHREILLKLEKNDEWQIKMESRLGDFITRTEPVVRIFENLSWSTKGLLIVCVAIATVAGAIVGIKEIISNLR